MNPVNHTILTINGGSSGIKYALYEAGDTFKLLFSGEVEFCDKDNPVDFLLNELEKQNHFDTVKAVGHRIVHGMKHTDAQLITPELLKDLKNISAYDPEHLPGEIKLIEAFAKHFPTIPQVACFDTAFHTAMPAVAKLLPIPRWLYKKGVHRYGFHGLSYAYLLEKLEALRVRKLHTAK